MGKKKSVVLISLIFSLTWCLLKPRSSKTLIADSGSLVMISGLNVVIFILFSFRFFVFILVFNRKKAIIIEDGFRKTRRRTPLGWRLFRGSQRAPARWGEEEPQHEVKAYQPDMPTEYSERRRDDNEVLRKPVR